MKPGIIVNALALCVMFATGPIAAQSRAAALARYADPAEPGLPQTDVDISLADTALVITDPQIDFLHPNGVTWGVVGESVTELGTVGNIETLLTTAKGERKPLSPAHTRFTAPSRTTSCCSCASAVSAK
jgi:hypothetical protein